MGGMKTYCVECPSDDRMINLDDFFVELDLSENQRSSANRLKREADKKQLQNTLQDHWIFYSRQAETGTARNAKQKDCSNQRLAVLAWFDSLNLEQRVAALTCNDQAWIRTVLSMANQQGPPGHGDGTFCISSQPQGSSPGKAGKTARVNSNSRPDPIVRYRRPHRLADGELLVPLATPEQRASFSSLVRGMRVAFADPSERGSAWSAVLPCRSLVADTAKFVEMMDHVSLGGFLQAEPVIPKRDGPVPWTDASWMHRWGKYFSLSAFVGSRLEALMIRSYLIYHNVAGVGNQMGHLAESLADMTAETREGCLRSLGQDLTRRMLTETVGRSADDTDDSWFQSVSVLASALADGEGSAPALLQSFSRAAPWEIAEAISTVPLMLAAQAPEGVTQETVRRRPGLWLQHQLVVQLARICSEHNAQRLLDKETDITAELATGKTARRREKKQRQKLRQKPEAVDRVQDLTPLQQPDSCLRPSDEAGEVASVEVRDTHVHEADIHDVMASSSADRLYSCGECGDSAELGAIDDSDGLWYCKPCWERFVAHNDRGIKDVANACPGGVGGEQAKELDTRLALFSRDMLESLVKEIALQDSAFLARVMAVSPN